jgi:ABC-type multidrug transport system ATPase subunit
MRARMVARRDDTTPLRWTWLDPCKAAPIQGRLPTWFKFVHALDFDTRVALSPEYHCAGVARPAAIPVAGTLLLGRGERMVNVRLDHPTVDLRHAKISTRGGQFLVADLRSTYGTFVDGERVRREQAIVRGSRITIGPFTFLFDGTSLIPQATASATQLSIWCDRLRRVVTNRVTGAPLTLLHDITIAVRPRELVCLIGPSGSGKSTLLTTLSGRMRPDQGRVVVGGRDLHAEFDAIKHDLAVVPQRDALHASLTVRQSLWYAAGLRLPSDTSSREIDAAVDGLLQEVGLAERQGVRVRDLSGGQLKRLSLANEIAHKPSLVFLDEVTSGLDELADEEMMQLFRQLVDKGRAVVCITHNTLNIERNAHLVVVLTTGGRLACVGAPAEVCDFFAIKRLGDIYAAMAKATAQSWESRFRQHPLFRRYVEERRPAAGPQAAVSQAATFRAVSARRPIGHARQFALLSGRVATLQVRDIKALAVSLSQAVFTGIMLAAAFGDLEHWDDAVTGLVKQRNAAFFLLVSVFWLGCNNAATEIVKERVLFERERAVSVDAGVYYLAKLCVLGMASLVQAFLVYTIVDSVCGLPCSGDAAGALQQALSVTAVAVLGTLTGLAISALSKSEEIAVRAVPIVLIPQIVLANVIAPLEGVLRWAAQILVSTYWSFQAFTSGVEEYYPPGDDPPAWLPPMGMLGVHAIAMVVLALVGLRPPSRGGGR